MKKVWLVEFVAGNPEIFTKVRNNNGKTFIRSQAIELAKGMNQAWRIWVKHVDTGEIIWESEAQKNFRLD